MFRAINKNKNCTHVVIFPCFLKSIPNAGGGALLRRIQRNVYLTWRTSERQGLKMMSSGEIQSKTRLVIQVDHGMVMMKCKKLEPSRNPRAAPERSRELLIRTGHLNESEYYCRVSLSTPISSSAYVCVTCCGQSNCKLIT